MSKGKPKQENSVPKALGYLRKSTKGNRSDGKRKQEKSIAQQKSEIQKLVKGRFDIVAWYTDEGVSGWKRGANRPDFKKMLDEAKGHGAQAIVVDNIDRFSRAAVGDVQEDANNLRKAGVRWIITANGKEFDLGSQYDIGTILDFVVCVWSSCEYSRQLSRRISLARRNAAEKGKRSGGIAPYGLANDRKGGLKFGDREQVKIVLWIFVQYVTHCRALNWIANELNRKGTKGPKGGKWYTMTVKEILTRRAYIGHFTYNERGQGHFFRIDENGEVVAAEKANGNGKIFEKEGVYKPLIEKKIFEKAQKRLQELSCNRGLRKRVGYALTGILRCQKCGGAMYGLKLRGKVVYRCGSNGNKGKDACENYQIREREILPFLLGLLGGELEDIGKMLSEPPEHLRSPKKHKREKREQTELRIETLTKQIATAEKNLLFVEDGRTRKSLDKQVTELRDELERLESLLTEEKPTKGYSKDELQALKEWWQDFEEKAVSVPIPKERQAIVPDHAYWFHRDREYFEELYLRMDPRAVNNALMELGTEVRLAWETEGYKTQNGVARKRHNLSGGRFRLGQKKGKIPRNVLEGSANRSNSDDAQTSAMHFASSERAPSRCSVVEDTSFETVTWPCR